MLTQIARAQGLQRDFAAAHRTLDEAEMLRDEADGTARIRCLLERGRVFNSAGESDRARPLFRAAWEVVADLGQDTFAVDSAHMLGIVEPSATGIEWNQRALALAETSAEPEARRWLGSLANNLGWAHHDAGDFVQALDCFKRALGRVDEALAEQQALRVELKAIRGQGGYVDEELGECLLAAVSDR